MRAPDFFTAFVDDGILVRVDVIGKGTGRCSPKVRKKLVFGVEGDDRKREFLKNRSGWGGRGNDSDRGFDDSGQEVLNWDIHEWDVVNNFFELEVDVGVLSFNGGGVLELWA